MRALLPLLLLLAGCAQDALTVERAGTVAAAGQPVVAEATALLADVARTSERAAIEIAVADRSCAWPNIRIATAETATALCAAPGEPGIDFEVLGAESLGPTLRLIGALAAYLEAVGRILAKEPVPAAAILAGVKADLDALGQVAGGGPKLSAQQAKAAGDLAAMVAALANAREEAARLRALEAQLPAVDPLIATLRADLERWTRLALASDLDTIDAALGQMQRRARAGAGDEAYRAILETRASIGRRRAAAAALSPALAAALDALAAARADFARAVEGRFNAGDRRRMAMITAERLREALRRIAATVAAFR